MFRPMSALALLIALAAASCRTGPSDERREEWNKGALIHWKLTGYNTIVSAHKGKIGYLKSYDVTEGGGNPYPWKRVYDGDWNELGFIDQFGNAYRFHAYSQAEQVFQNLPLRADKLPADSLENNVMRMFDIDLTSDRLTFPVSTKGDITGDKGGAPLAGPGVTPAPGTAVPEKAPPK